MVNQLIGKETKTRTIFKMEYSVLNIVKVNPDKIWKLLTGAQ
jgi:hypothetical protein